MKWKLKKLAAMVTSIFMATMIILPGTPAFAGRIIYDNETGTHGGYDYELWKDYGNTIMELNDGGTFSCQWSNIGNALFRKGRKFNSDKTYQELGDIVVEYGCDYNPNGNSYLCVYGWTRNPLVEYYIVESWGSWRPPGATPKGTIIVDGGTYEIYETTRVNQPSIDGTATFQQYWSVRTSRRTSGTVSVTEHFKQWERMGMQMGKMYEVALTVEGYQSSGSANVYKNEIRIGANPTPGPSPSPSTRDAFSTIEAEQYNSTNSSTLQEIGTPNNGRGIGYIENGNTVTYSNIDFGSDGATGFSATIATEVNTSIQIRSDSATGTLLGTLYVSSTGSWNTYQTVSTNISKITGVHDIVLVFSGPVNVDNFIFTRSSPEPAPGDNTRDAYSNIQAEDYDSSYGPNLRTFSLPGGGSAIGYIENGYYTTYNNVDFANGLSSITIRVATQIATTIQVRSGGSTGTLLGTIYVPSTNSWDSYQNVTASLNNITGLHDITLVFSGPVNVDYFVFTPAGVNPEPNPPVGGTRSAFSNIQAEDYDSSYGPNLRTFSLPDGGSAIGYIENGYYTTYRNIDFGDGATSVTARVATQIATTIQIRLGNASGTLLGTISVGSTGSFDTYRNVSATISNITGVKDIVLVFSGPVNVDWFVFSKGGTPTDPTGKKLVALTFDDGPNTTTTPLILDILEREGVVATFFLIGSNINDSVKPVMQRQVSLGCELANHSWSHSDMSNMSYYQIQQEITNTNNKIYQMVGVTPKFFRPPYISVSNTMYEAIDLPFIGGLTCNDWDNSTSAEQRASIVLNNVRDGDIVLLHDFDGNYNTVQALGTIIQGLKDRGYAFVTVSQLFELKGINPNVEYKIWNGAY